MSNRTLNGAQEDLLEQFVDSTSLAHLLHTLADIASSKAEHIGANWQDNDLAQRWNKAAKAVSACASSVAVGGVS